MGGAGLAARGAAIAYDVVVAGMHEPKSDCLYQASRAATYLGLAARPAVAEGGLIVLAADLPLGAGDGPGERNFLDVLAAASSPPSCSSAGCASRSARAGSARSSSPACSRGSASPWPAPPTRRSSSLSPTSGWPRSTPSTRPSPPRTSRLGRRASVLAVADAMATVVTAA